MIGRTAASATMLCALLTLVGRGSAPRATTTPSAPMPASVTVTAAPTKAAPVDVVLPEVKDRNGAIVYDELNKLGLTNVQYASRDAEDKVVVLPSNWSAVRIEPGAGTMVKSDAVVVVTMSHSG